MRHSENNNISAKIAKMEAKQDSLLRRLWAAAVAVKVPERKVASVAPGRGGGRPSKLQLQEAIMSLGKVILDNSSSSRSASNSDVDEEDDIDYDDIISKICNFLGKDLAEVLVRSEFAALQALVVCAVSERCELQTEILQSMMELEHADQLQLMEIIQSDLSDLEAPKSQPSMSEPTTIHANTSNNSITASANSTVINTNVIDAIADSERYSFPIHNSENSSSSSNTLLEVEIAGESDPYSLKNSQCQKCVSKQKDVESLQSQANALRAEIACMEDGLRREVQGQNQLVIDMELEILEKDNNLAQGEAEMAEMTKRIERLKESVSESHKLMQNFQKISDEVEVTRPLAERAPQLEAALQSCSAKLENLANVRSQLIAESNAHSATYSQLLEIQNEVSVLKEYKSQLENYQKQYNELSQIVEVASGQLRLQDEEIQALRNEKKRLLHGFETTEDMNAQLELELAAQQERLDNLKNGIGLEEAMMELNPELMKELKFLRKENTDLLAMVEDTSEESLGKLEASVNEQISSNGQLQQKLMSLKDDVQRTLQRISNLELMLATVSRDFRLFQGQCNEKASMFDEELKGKVNMHNKQMRSMRNQDSAILSLMTTSRQLLVSDLNTVIQSNDQIIKEKNNEISSLYSNISILNNDISTLDADNERLTNFNLESIENYKQELETAKENGSRRIVGMKRDFESRLSEMDASYTSVLDGEKAKFVQMEGELEEERSKKRRLEREKRVAEAESLRHKSQLQLSLTNASSGASSMNSAEIEGVIRDMRSLQQELESLKSENLSLKARESFRLGKISEVDKTINTRARVFQNEDNKGLVSRPQRGVRVSDDLNASICEAASTNSGMPVSNMSIGFADASELADRRVEQLMKERRELIAKSLEENKNKAEAKQKLMLMEQEAAALKARITKTTLEKERLERRILKAGGSLNCRDENSINC